MYFIPSLVCLIVGTILFIQIRKFHKNVVVILEEKAALLHRETGGHSSLHLVISIGKCGGSTLALSLRRSFFPRPINHVHAISEQGMNLAARMWLDPDVISLQADKKQVHAAMKHLRAARNSRIAIEECRARFGRPLGYYTCGVREPLALAVSGYFQNFDPSKTLDTFSLEQARLDILNGPVLRKEGIYEGGLDGWFDREILGVLGIDVFSHPFNIEEGYSVIESEGVRVLVIRQENFGALSKAFSSLYRAPAVLFETADANRAKDKAFSATYKKAVSMIKFSAEELDDFYASKYVRHFYSEEEIALFKAKWLA